MNILSKIRDYLQKDDANPGILKSESSMPVLANTYTGDLDGFWMINNVGTDYWFSYKDNSSAAKAYTDCPPVFSIVNKIAQAYLNGKTWILDDKGKESFSPAANKIRKLLNKPNAVQTWRQFEAQCDIYMSLFGYCVLLPMKPVGFPNNTATAIWNIPPNLLEIKESDDPFFIGDAPIKKITMVYNNTRYNINPDMVYFLKDTSTSLCSPNLPQSRLRSQEMNINNIIGTLESLNVITNRRGALGILSSDKSDSNGNISLTPGEKKDAQDEFMQYGLQKNQSQVIITNAALKWQQMGYSTKDLMLNETIENATMSLCDTFNFPFRLLSANSSNSLAGSDVQYYNQQLYQNCIIPRAESMYEQWNIFFGMAEMNLILDKDFSHVGALQEDKVKNNQARLILNQALNIEWQNNLITANEWLVKNGEDPKGPDFDKYYYEFVAAGKALGNTITQPQIAQNGQ